MLATLLAARGIGLPAIAVKLYQLELYLALRVHSWPDWIPLHVAVSLPGYPIGKGADLFISVWNLHRSPYLWKDPDTFRPERFSETNTNEDFGGKWAGEQARPSAKPQCHPPSHNEGCTRVMLAHLCLGLA